MINLEPITEEEKLEVLKYEKKEITEEDILVMRQRKVRANHILKGSYE